MVTYRAPDALKIIPDVSGEHRSRAQRGLQMCRVTGPTHRTRSKASSPLPREHCKCARTPDAHHRTHPERPVLSVRNTRRSQAAPDAPTGFNLCPVPSVRCLTLTRPRTDSTPDAQPQRPMPPQSSSGDTPATSPNFPPAQQKICISFSQKHQREEPKPSLPFKLHRLLKVCQHHNV